MFAYDWQKPNGPLLLVIVSGGKQSRVSGATIGAQIRDHATDYQYIGQVDDQTAAWFKSTWGPITGG